MSIRINISFKDNELDKQLLEYFKEKSKLIGPSAYIKQLLYDDMMKNIQNKSKK